MSTDEPTSKGQLITSRDGLPTATRPRTRRKLSEIAWAIQEEIPVELLRDYYVAIVMGHSPFWRRAKDGDLEVTWGERGEDVPTLAERSNAVQRLMDYGIGTPIQRHQVEASMRVQASHNRLDQLGLTPEAFLTAVEILEHALLASDETKALPEPTSTGELEPATLDGTVLRRKPGY